MADKSSKTPPQDAWQSQIAELRRRFAALWVTAAEPASADQDHDRELEELRSEYDRFVSSGTVVDAEQDLEIQALKMQVDALSSFGIAGTGAIGRVLTQGFDKVSTRLEQLRHLDRTPPPIEFGVDGERLRALQDSLQGPGEDPVGGEEEIPPEANVPYLWQTIPAPGAIQGAIQTIRYQVPDEAI